VKLSKSFSAHVWVPIVVCLIVFWRIPFTWFFNDDFGWLAVPLDVQSDGFWHTFATPKVQGTMRILADRTFFFAFSSLFGLHALPYKLFVLATWCASLGLAAAIGARLTGSRLAGALAAILWTTNVNVTTPLAWVSAYNQVLCAFLLLLAFYSRLRGWRIAEWIAFLAAFGALEIAVVYPAIALLHAVLFDRERVKGTLALFIPAIVFSAAHFLFIPKASGPYGLVVDSRIISTFARYLGWSIAPSRMDEWFGPSWRVPGWIAAAVVALGLLVVIVGRPPWSARSPLAPQIKVLFVAWFLITLAPVLPLPLHVTDYYLTLPVLGLCWLAGWAIAIAPRAIGVPLLALYLAASVAEIQAATKYYDERSNRLKTVVLGLRDAARDHPNTPLMLRGIDRELIDAGLDDNAFRLANLDRVYFAPGDEKNVPAVTVDQARELLSQGARVLQTAGDRMADVTTIYSTAVRPPPPAIVYGPTWYPPEGQVRWMPKRAKLQLPGWPSGARKLVAEGFAPAAVVAQGPVTIRASAGARALGTATVSKPEQRFTFEIGLPDALAGTASVEITLEVSRVLHVPNDPRELGMAFVTFSVR
jgi:hypothetical protein